MAGIVNTFVGLFTKVPNQIGNVIVDCFVREEHDSEIKVTEFPIEVGANINDHAIILPKALRIYGVVSDIPNNLTGINTQNFTAGSSKTRSISAYQALLKLQEDREPIDVVTGLRIYKNMVIVSLKVDRDRDTSGGVYFTCDFKELIIVSNEYTRLPPGTFREGPTREQASQTVREGRKPSESPRDQTTFRALIGQKVDAAKAEV